MDIFGLVEVGNLGGRNMGGCFSILHCICLLLSWWRAWRRGGRGREGGRRFLASLADGTSLGQAAAMTAAATTAATGGGGWRLLFYRKSSSTIRCVPSLACDRLPAFCCIFIVTNVSVFVAFTCPVYELPPRFGGNTVMLMLGIRVVEYLRYN